MSKYYNMRLCKIVNSNDVFVEQLLKAKNFQNQETINFGLDDYLFIDKSFENEQMIIYLARSDTNNIAIVQNNTVNEQELKEGQTLIHQSLFCIIWHDYLLYSTEKNLSIYWLKQYLCKKLNLNFDIQSCIHKDVLSQVKNVSGIWIEGVKDIKTEDKKVAELLAKTKENSPEELFREYNPAIYLGLTPRSFRRDWELQEELRKKQTDIDNMVKDFIENSEEESFTIMLRNGQKIKNSKLKVYGTFQSDILPTTEMRKTKHFRELNNWKQFLLTNGLMEND